MILHILKLIKSQFRSNGWVLAELLVVFVILWFLTDYFLMQGILTNRPVGFKLDNVYQAVVSVRPSNNPSYIQYEEGSKESMHNFERIVERIRQHPDVEAVGLSYYSLPYTRSNMGNGVRKDSLMINVRSMMVSPDYFRVFGIHSSTGGSPEEMGSKLPEMMDEKSVILSADLAQELYGRTDAVGAEFYGYDSIPKRVVAVTEPVRNDEYDKRHQYVVFTRYDLPLVAEKKMMKEADFSFVQVTFRTRPGVASPDFANRFMKEMKTQLMAGNFWVSAVNSYPKMRTDFLADSMDRNMAKLFSALGGFFLVNVLLAIVGTFWFRVNRRRAELGLRMAVGSTRMGIRSLMVGEGLVLLTLASLPALLICGNLMWMEMVSTKVLEISVWRYVAVSLLTWGVLAVVIVFGTWYPARRAARLEPADALHYE